MLTFNLARAHNDEIDGPENLIKQNHNKDSSPADREALQISLPDKRGNARGLIRLHFTRLQLRNPNVLQR